MFVPIPGDRLQRCNSAFVECEVAPWIFSSCGATIARMSSANGNKVRTEINPAAVGLSDGLSIRFVIETGIRRSRPSGSAATIRSFR
jgi:hypothetical protein